MQKIELKKPLRSKWLLLSIYSLWSAHLLISKEKKNLTKEEINIRRNQEIKAPYEKVGPPGHFASAQKKEFESIAAQLLDVNIMTNLDCEALARYIVSKDIYNSVSKKLRRKEVFEDIDLLEKYSKTHDRYFKICRASAIDLGLTISSRYKLIMPESVNKEPPKINKFERFVTG